MSNSKPERLSLGHWTGYEDKKPSDEEQYDPVFMTGYESGVWERCFAKGFIHVDLNKEETEKPLCVKARKRGTEARGHDQPTTLE